MVLDYSSFTCVGLCRDAVCIVFGNQTEQSGVGAGRRKRKKKGEIFSALPKMRNCMKRDRVRRDTRNTNRHRRQIRSVRRAAGGSHGERRQAESAGNAGEIGKI